MQRVVRWAVPLAVLVLIGAAGYGAFLAVRQGVRDMFPTAAPTPVSAISSEAHWVVMRTEGGTLEVSTINAPGEVIERTDFAKFGPIDLGSTVSHLRVAATYRYHIPLAPEWKIVAKDGKVVVVAPKVRPTLPVAFDSASVYRHVEAGWFRFDKEESLKTAEKLVTAELALRAGTSGAIDQQREQARLTVTEFVRKWLLTQESLKGTLPANVRVVFADEPIERLGSEAVTFSGL